MRLSFEAVTTLLLLSAPAGAQYPAIDSSAVARSAWREAQLALRADDLSSAARLIDRAAAAWPIQPAYQRTRALLAARRDEDSTLGHALMALAGLESGGDLAADSAIGRRARQSTTIEALLRLLTNASAPRIRSTIWQTVPDTTVFAEGIAADSVSGHLFLTSIRHRTIYELDGEGGIRDMRLARQDVAAVLAVRVHPDGRHLWAVTSGLPTMEGYRSADSSLAELLYIRRSDGAVERRWDVVADGSRHILGDLAIGPAGDVFVSDSWSPVLYRLRPGADTLERITHPLFRSLQGLTPRPDGGSLYVADFSHGILRVDLTSGAVVRLDDAPNSTSLGLDGLGWYNGSLVGIQNGVSPPRVVAIDLDPTGDVISAIRTLDRHVPLADEPTALSVLGHTLFYVANSQWEKYDDVGTRRPGTRLAPTTILRLLLTR